MIRLSTQLLPARRSRVLRPIAFRSFAVLVLAVSSGCHQDGGKHPVPDGVIELRVGTRLARVEVVSDDRLRQRGLMYRESLPKDEGMLFLFPTKRSLSFWMRNTLIPLSIAYIDDEGMILEIRDMRPKDESSTRSKHEVRFALEMNQRWFREAGADVGTLIPEFQAKIAPFPVR
jgi:uncharacterized membrane protein (UPF0127 family)